MPSLQEIVEAWGAPEREKRVARRYCALAMADHGPLRALFAQTTYERFLAHVDEGRAYKDAGIVRSFLRHVQTEWMEGTDLSLPRRRGGKPALRTTVPSLLVARFVATLCPSRKKLMGAELFRVVGDVAEELGKPSESVSAKDLCRVEVAERLRERVLLRGRYSQLECFPVARQFFRLQAEAAGVPIAEQKAILALLHLPPAPATSRKLPRSPWCEGYLRHMQALGRVSLKTIGNQVMYFERWAVHTFPELMDGQHNLDLVSLLPEHVQAYSEWILSKMSTRSTFDYLSRLRGYLQWLNGQGEVADDVLLVLDRVSQKTRPMPEAWTLDQVLRLWTAVMAGGNLRDAVLFGLLLATGPRPSELLHLQLSDWDPKRSRMRYFGKGRERWVPVRSQRVRDDLERYLSRRPVPYHPGDQTTFLMDSGRAMRWDYLTRVFRRYQALAGLNTDDSLLILRHTFATLLLEEGVPLLVRMALMGQSEVESQTAYTKTSLLDAGERAARRCRDAKKRR